MTLILKTLAWLKGLQIAYLLSFLSYKLGKYIHNKFSARILNFIRSDYFSKFLIYEFTFYFIAVISIPLITIVQLSFLVNIYPQLEPIILLYNIYTPDIIKQIVTTIILIQNWQFDLMIELFVYLFKVGETHAVSSMDLFMSITPLFVTVKGAIKNINNYFGEVVDKPNKATRGDIILSTFYYVFTEYFIIVMFLSVFILFGMCYTIYSSILCLLKFMLTSGMDHGYLVFTMASPIFVTIRHASTKSTRKTTIQKNMVTLKSLKEELDAMKSKHAAVASHTITNDAKGNQTIKTRWSVNPLALMTIISFILTYGAKLPYVSNIVKMLALWYGRRGWWKLLVRFRSGFLYLNAFIGIIWICDFVGFGPTNILAGLTGLGPAYLDIITNTYKTIHNWIFGLFDTKVVPDVPSNPSWKFWQSGGVSPKMAGIDTSNPLLDYMHRTPHESLREHYKSTPDITINNYTSSWGSLYNWIWYGGIGLISNKRIISYQIGI